MKHILLFLKVCKETFHKFRVRISQKVESVLLDVHEVSWPGLVGLLTRWGDIILHSSRISYLTSETLLLRWERSIVLMMKIYWFSMWFPEGCSSSILLYSVIWVRSFFAIFFQLHGLLLLWLMNQKKVQ